MCETGYAGTGLTVAERASGGPLLSNVSRGSQVSQAYVDEWISVLTEHQDAGVTVIVGCTYHVGGKVRPGRPQQRDMGVHMREQMHTCMPLRPCASAGARGHPQQREMRMGKCERIHMCMLRTALCASAGAPHRPRADEICATRRHYHRRHLLPVI